MDNDAIKIVVKDLEYVRQRLVDMVNGDEDVDVGTMISFINTTISNLGGRPMIFKPHELKSHFFKEID